MSIETVENYFWNEAKDTLFVATTLANQPVDETIIGNMIRIPAPPSKEHGWQWKRDKWVQIDDEKNLLPDLPARQFWLAALSVGITEDSLVEAISGPSSSSYIPDPVARQEAIIDIRKATSFSRSYPTLDQLATAQGIPAEQLDALWMWATTI